MSSYQHIFSTNAVLNVWRNLRNPRDQNDLVLAIQYQTEDIRGPRKPRAAKSVAKDASTDEVGRGGAGSGAGAAIDGRSIGFVVPWRSMQAQKRELRERDKELAEALVMLAGETPFTELPPTLQSRFVQNPLIQIRHLAAGISRQMSKFEIQMADNAPFARGKNLYTGGELIRKFLPPIQMLFEQKPVPQRMIFELLMELKDLVYISMASCEAEVLEWELNNFPSFEDLDDTMVRTITPTPSDISREASLSPGRRLLKRKASFSPASSSTPRLWLHDAGDEILYHLDSLEATASAMSHLSIPVQDFLAKSTVTLRRTLPRSTMNDHSVEKRRRKGHCAEYARCMKWAGTSWKQGGGCRRGCRNEDEDPEGLPSWHSSSRWHHESGTHMIGGGKAGLAPSDDILRLPETN